MFSPWVLLFLTGGYLSLLFMVAWFAERREKRGASVVSNPYVYSLSLAVYCTTWTYYGSVGKAAVSGLSFLTIYIGPTLMASLWWIVLRKIVSIAREHRITTIADFIGFRYGNSLLLAGIVTVVVFIGITPYLGLQIKAIMSTFTILAGERQGSFAAAWVITAIIALFAVIFGVRHHDMSEKHEGLVFAIAFESIVKLAAFLMVGLYVTYFLFDGFGDIFTRIEGMGLGKLLAIGDDSPVGYTEWASLTFLSMMAVVFLPRQFHMAVVENYDISHISKAMWLFPLYLLLINVFVLPIAFGGLLLGGSAAEADTFVLTIPMGRGQNTLALLVFLGGVSAASGMIIVESLAVSNMIMNNIVTPVLYRVFKIQGLSLLISSIKRIVILGFIFTGYLFAVTVGEYFTLVSMGLISFVAVTIFAPSLIFGLYWKRGNRNGAIAGVVAGFIVWLYTTLLPALLKAGIISSEGTFGSTMKSHMLNPHALFGIHGLDEWSHALFWGMLFNIGIYVTVSLLTSQSEEEERKALSLVESYSPARMLPAKSSVLEIEDILAQIIGRNESHEVIERTIATQAISREAVSPRDLIRVQEEAQRVLSGMLGSSIAGLVFEDRLAYSDQERVELLSTIKEMNKTLRLSRRELANTNQELAFLKDFSENIIESLPLGVATLDSRMFVRYWNRGMESITGLGKEAALGTSASRVLSFLPREIITSPIRVGDFQCSSELLELKGYVSTLTGTQQGCVIVLEDVTEGKKIEQELFQATKHASVGRLAAGVSHEIGNPLASISSLVQEMLTEENVDFTQESLETVNHHVDRIARIVKNLGDFARINTRQKVLTGLDEILDSTLALVKYDTNFRKIVIETHLHHSSEVKVDPDQIQQVFLNLILNARDAMPEGGKLVITIRQLKGVVEVIFTDTGSGVDPAIRDKIFDPFFTTKGGPIRGTGLGLGISYGIMRDHGGSVEIVDGESGGASFIIRFPVGKRE